MRLIVKDGGRKRSWPISMLGCLCFSTDSNWIHPEYKLDALRLMFLLIDWFLINQIISE